MCMVKDIFWGISIHALREEGDLFGRKYVTQDDLFLSTPSARRATTPGMLLWTLLSYFYPRPPRGGRHRSRGYADTPVKFLSTPSARRATAFQHLHLGVLGISIHALREEGDRPAHDRHL